jgi:general secretion pathway protein G
MKVRRRTHHQESRAAFTLLEVLLVLAIIVVIAALAVPQLLGRQQEALIKAAKANVKAFEDAARYYAVDHDGVYPAGDTATVTELLIMPPPTRDGRPGKSYLDEPVLDPWGNPLMYEYPPQSKPVRGDKPAIWSHGPNPEDPSDDIGNWRITDI